VSSVGGMNGGRSGCRLQAACDPNTPRQRDARARRGGRALHPVVTFPAPTGNVCGEAASLRGLALGLSAGLSRPAIASACLSARGGCAGGRRDSEVSRGGLTIKKGLGSLVFGLGICSRLEFLNSSRVRHAKTKAQRPKTIFYLFPSSGRLACACVRLAMFKSCSHEA
jgi:hypothetical protein